MSKDYRILVAIDLQSGTGALLAEVQRFALALNAVVDVIHVAPDDPEFIGYIKGSAPLGQGHADPERGPAAQDLRDERRQTQDLAAMLSANGVRLDRVLTVQEPVLDAIFEQVHKLGSDMLVVGAHCRGALYRLWYGDVAVGAVKRPPCAVLVIPIEV